MSSLLAIEMFWYASFQLDRDLLIDHRRGSHTRQPDRRNKLSKDSARSLPEEIFREDAPEKSRLDNASCSRKTEQSCCAICINDFRTGERVKNLPSCHHLFHSKCIIHWLTEYNNSCPLCTKPVIVLETHA